MMFRSDINLLRAISVLGVVIYHFNPHLLTGGFVGVDVFFVISGYLMTRIIFIKLEKNEFSYFEFLKSRCKRIIPPLAFMVLVFLMINWFLSYSVYYQEQGKHGLASLGFISNIVYWQESGYFDSLSKGKLFLHTWSLSVEWQFYLLYPAILISCKKLFGLKSSNWVLGGISIVSLALCLWGSSRYPSATFYLLPTRAWEMTLGGLIFFTSCNLSVLVRRCVSISGILVILSSMSIFDESTIWPSYFTILPAIGAALVIWSKYEDKMFNNKVIIWLGLGSYSLYLWHWPLLAMRFNGFIDYNDLLIIIFIIVMSFLSYYFLERK